MPSDLAALLDLPGVGAYTARAVQAFAFEIDVGVVDTNIGRLLARWTGEPLSATSAQITADELVPAGRGWQWNQALFDFAVAVCSKRAPRCESCPLREHCAWSGVGPDPASGSAGVSVPQSAFAGSFRQARGRVVDGLRQRPRRVDSLDPLVGTHDRDAVVESLLRDGLAERVGSFVQLPASGISQL